MAEVKAQPGKGFVDVASRRSNRSAGSRAVNLPKKLSLEMSRSLTWVRNPSMEGTLMASEKRSTSGSAAQYAIWQQADKADRSGRAGGLVAQQPQSVAVPPSLTAPNTPAMTSTCQVSHLDVAVQLPVLGEGDGQAAGGAVDQADVVAVVEPVDQRHEVGVRAEVQQEEAGEEAQVNGPANHRRLGRTDLLGLRGAGAGQA